MNYSSKHAELEIFQERITSQIGRDNFSTLATPVTDIVSANRKVRHADSLVLALNPAITDTTAQLSYLNALTNRQKDTCEAYWYHPDHLGSSSWITYTDGSAVQHLHYLPWGEDFVDQRTTNWHAMHTFSAKEKDSETGFSYFGSRYYSSDLSIWLSVDPMADNYPSTSPYAYCRNNPIILFDPNGMWDVKVSASADRGNNPYATFTVYDRNGNEVYKTIVMVKGLHRKRGKENGDTPTGVYKILEWRKTGGERYDTERYGENDLLALEYEEGAGEGNRFDSEDKRGNMHVHGGRKRKDRLVNTLGCIRMADDDIKELKSITDNLEKDPKEKRGILVVSDDLDSPVKYSDRQKFKESVSTEKHITLEKVIIQ